MTNAAMIELAKQDALNRTFTFHYDPGHGWLEVTLADINVVDLIVSAISRYSYRKGTTFYLEEDCDAGKFIGAYRNKFNREPNIREIGDGAFIRNLPRVR